MPRLSATLFTTFIIFCLWVSVAWATDQKELADLDIEELMDVEIVTVSRRPEPLIQLPGAVTVLDEEDIFRSGATSLPEVLKLVPGVHVSRIDTERWQVGIRGFNGMLSNKHLVMVDGRPVTSPTMANVFWANMVPVSMVKRIEVVRGVWTSLWGADSFTGVINIITKTAAEMEGGKSVTVAGSSGLEQTLSYGTAIGDTGHLAGYANAAYTTSNLLTDESDRRESSDFKKQRVGFRYDWENAFTDVMSFQGDMAASSFETTMPMAPPGGPVQSNEGSSGFCQFVWDRATGLDAGLKFRTSYTRDGDSFGDLKGASNVVDAELQHAVEQMGRHRLTWGVGSRYFWDDYSSGDKVSIDLDNRYTFTATAFAQDRITLLEERMYLILGTKVDYIQEKVELQPTGRLMYTRDDDEFWLAVSRGVRAENRIQRSGTYPININGQRYTVVIPGDLDVEKLIAYEAGYRRSLADSLLFDLNFYVNEYDDLIAFEYDHAKQTARLANTLRGAAYGTEVMFDWQMNDQVRFRPSVSVIYQDLYGIEQIDSTQSPPEEGWGSEYKLQVMTNPWKNIGLDGYVSYIESPDNWKNGVIGLEGHLSWQASDNLLLELIGRNLDGGTEYFSRTYVGPRVDLRMTWDF